MCVFGFCIFWALWILLLKIPFYHSRWCTHPVAIMCFSETHDLQVVLFLFKFPERSSVTDRDVICHVVYVCVSPSTCVVCFLRLPPKVQLQGLQHPPFAHGALLTRQALFWWSSYNPGFQSSSREQQPHQKTQTGMALFSLVKCSSSKNMTIADFAALMFFHFFAYKHILRLVADGGMKPFYQFKNNICHEQIISCITFKEWHVSKIVPDQWASKLG